MPDHWAGEPVAVIPIGMIKASPQKILAQAADWRFLDELKKELKG